MKVLSLKEPFATLIKDGIKNIETRSWKTNYRGELYIHASSAIISKECLENKKLMSLGKDINYNYGHIICKCMLIDCIYMTEDYINYVKENYPEEYLCGLFEVGRYAWILDNIVPLNKPIKAKGNLNIWNYYDDLDVMKLMQNIEYGWIDKNNNKHFIVDEQYSENYRLQSPKDVLNNKIGVCWDQVELQRYFFKNNTWDVKTFFICHYDDDKCPSHTFLTYMKNNKYYWFEHSWDINRGIHQYNSLKELLLDVKKKFILTIPKNDFNSNNLLLREYSKPVFNINPLEFYMHCEKNNPIEC